jgi:hypothetical protein
MCSKRPPSISNQTKILSAVFSQNCLNVLALATLTAVWSLAARSKIIVGQAAYTCLFKCPHKRKSFVVNGGNRRSQAFGPRFSVHLHGYVAFNQWETQYPQNKLKIKSACELCLPSDRRLAEKLLQTFADWRIHVVSVTIPTAVFSVF